MKKYMLIFAIITIFGMIACGDGSSTETSVDPVDTTVLQKDTLVIQVEGGKLSTNDTTLLKDKEK